MAHQTHRQTITAIVAAYNEATRIGEVLNVLTRFPNFHEIIVVDDGSTDGTAAIARKFSNVRVIVLPTNSGKGIALAHGVQLARGDILFFCDADITGVTQKMITSLLRPVLAGEVEMVVALRNRRWYLEHLILPFIPLVGGERCLTRALWERLPPFYKQKFRIEVALNFFAVYYGKGLRPILVHDVAHNIKEKKYGLAEGFRRRLGMMWDIAHTMWRLHALEIPATIANARRLLFRFTRALVMLLLAIIFLNVGVGGPGRILALPPAPFQSALLHAGSFAGRQLLVLLGMIILLSAIIIAIISLEQLLALSGTLPRRRKESLTHHAP